VIPLSHHHLHHHHHHTPRPEARDIHPLASIASLIFSLCYLVDFASLHSLKMTSKNIVILGASFAGLPMAHYLIKHLPEEYTVTLVSPSTHLFWNVAAPRAIVDPELLGKGKDDLFIPILPSFEKYPSGRFTFIQGKAVSTSPETNTVTVQTVNDNDTSLDVRQVNVEYLHLIVATGSSTAGGDWAFKAAGKGTHVATRAALASTRERIAAANRIVISGAGATGCELTGEIASKYHKSGKHITLLSSAAGLLPVAPPGVGKTAEGHLTKMGVEVRNNVKVTSETKKGDVTELVLSTGETIETDLHIATWGLVPNTSFMPKDLLDASGWIVTDKYLKTPTHSNIWALGDVTHWGNRGIGPIKGHHSSVSTNVLATIAGKDESSFKEYKHSDDLILIVPLGPWFGRATGILFGWKVWGVIAWALKGRTYMIDFARPIAEGKNTAGRTKI
jgi:NADH dehydrogenase FAD-containing subunit